MKSKMAKMTYWFSVTVLLGISSIIRDLCDWFDVRFGVSFEEVLFTITSPLEGSDTSFMDEAIEYVIPGLFSTFVVILIISCILAAFKFFSVKIEIRMGKIRCKMDLAKMLKVVCLVVSLISVVCSIGYGVRCLGIDEYIARKRQKTTIYEEYYVNPEDVTITCTDKPKNLIYIYMESMETTYASIAEGGYQEINYIPNLTQMAKENISFSDSERLGGAKLTVGATWTMGALFSITTGAPFSVPVNGNSMDTFKEFTPGIITLGDILEKKGYNQKFVCGSNGEFGGRENYFTQHGNYDVVDYFDAIEKEYIDKDYYVWWGYEDLKLYDIAKKELQEMVDKGEPFNFTMLTVDTHHVDGYVCENCKDTYSNQLANVVQCSDEQIYEFINWCKEQEFYEDTVIIITGDHYRMDSTLIPEGAERRLYNCYINSATQPEGGIVNRQYTSLDLFPTTLAAMGFEIEGNRLGLGTNLFSTEKTLAEEIGFDALNGELGKYSQYYKDNFEK